MMKFGVLASLVLLVIYNISRADALLSGVTIDNIDHSVRLQDDFYGHMNGKWLKTTKIPEDRAVWGTFQILSQNTTEQLYEVIGKLKKQKLVVSNSDDEKILFLYDSYMNESKLDTLGIAPILPLLNMVDKMSSKSDIPVIIGQFNKYGINAPYGIGIHRDVKDSEIVVPDIVQSGLGLPDRDYYLESQDRNLNLIKSKYQEFISDMLKLSRIDNAEKVANDIVGLETQLAKIHWSKVQNRDPIKTYNKVMVDKLNTIMSKYDWSKYLVASDLNDKINYLIVSQPSYLVGLDKLIDEVSLSIWKEYFKWQIINSYAGVLSASFHNLSFKFYGTTLKGVEKETPRYRQAIDLVNGNLGFAFGRLYVKEYFPESSKIEINKLVNNLIREYAMSIESLTWMGKKTKFEAKKKLTHMALKIAYPDSWMDYSKLVIKKDDLVGNLIRSSEFEYDRDINKLGKKVDRTEWDMVPQTVNAYYNPEFNEIVFPAAILQSPFFSFKADIAANYGGIGAVIGHEISHAFDDQGSQYDERGNLRNWWTVSDRQNFKKMTQQLVKQYSKYSPIDGYYVNGELTLGENIADNSGLSIAYRAYHLSLGDKKAPVIDGMTGDQRLYANWAQVWCTKIRDKQVLMFLKVDPHSPAKFRANGTLSNQDGFYKAYHIESSDKMYVKPTDRVNIW